MNVIFSSKDVKITGALKGYVREKMIPLEKIEGPIMDVKVMVAREKTGYSTEMIVKTRLNTYQTREVHEILKQSLRRSLQKIKKQVKKNKAKIKDKKRILKKNNTIQDTYRSEDIKETEKVEVVRNYFPRPLSVAQATGELKKSGEKALLFRNRDNEKTSVLYFQTPDSLALIEEEI